VTVIAAVLVLGGCLYIMFSYQHPEDNNTAWVPKLIVLLGMCVAVWSVLLFPLDVANTQACAQNVSPSACSYTLPMHAIWYGIFIGNLVLTFIVMPFTLFFYEADSD
jgi:LMBR1 domain-containing protein 1